MNYNNIALITQIFGTILLAKELILIIAITNFQKKKLEIKKKIIRNFQSTIQVQYYECTYYKH